MSKRQRARRGTDQIQRRVDKRGLVTYYARYTEAGKRKFAVLQATDDKAAKLELAEMLIRVRKGESAVSTSDTKSEVGLTVRQLAERFCGWTDDKATCFATGAGEENRRPRKYRAQFWSVLDCHVLPHVGSLPAAELRRADLVRMLDALNVGKVGARTIEKAIRNTSKLFNWAIERELVKENPAFKLKGPKYKSKSDYYTDAEIAKMMATAAEQGSDLYPIIALFAYGGLRTGEVAALQRQDVDLDGAKIDVSRSWDIAARKSGESVTVHMHPHLLVIMKAHLESQGDLPGTALVFPDPTTGSMRPLHDSKRGCWGMRDLAATAGARRFRYPRHAIRHTAGSALAAVGASLPEIQAALGQSSLEMARRYTHIANAAVKQRVQSIAAYGPVVDLGEARRQKLGKRTATQNG
jgi:integrase